MFFGYCAKSRPAQHIRPKKFRKSDPKDMSQVQERLILFSVFNPLERTPFMKHLLSILLNEFLGQVSPLASGL